MLKIILIPLLGTLLGATCVFFMKKEISKSVSKMLSGFAGGVMVAASVWSLLIPSMEQSNHMGKWAFIPGVTGFLAGILFLLLLDHIIPHLHVSENKSEGPKCNLKKTTMLVLAVTIHNIPEGMAVGVVYAGWKSGNGTITLMGAMALSIGIAIQNFPEGAIISMPLCAKGSSRTKSFIYGTLSGVVEPISSYITILLASFIVPVLPYLLSFAAGAMMYVVVEELVPEMSEGEHSDLGPILFGIGFAAMMTLDVVLG